MRKINFLFAIILISIVLLSIASIAFSQTIKKTFELPEFKSIYVNSNYTVMLKQTNKQEVVAETMPDIMELTNIVVDNGVLMVNVERKPDNPSKSVWAKIDDIKAKPTMKLYVSVKNIGELQVNGGGKIVTENSLSSDYLTLSVSGNGSMDLDIKGTTLKTDISGSGSIALKGYATSNQITNSGSGTLNAFSCELESAKVKISGSGSAEISVTATLDALVLGSGSIKLKGNTKSVTKKVYGSGSIDRAY
jgi:Putative auto-transporter adhesin, head GIN domain